MFVSATDLDAGVNSHVAISTKRVPKSICAMDNYGYFRSSKQHADGCLTGKVYDFLLMFSSDLGSRWDRC